MKHLLVRPQSSQVGVLFRTLPCRSSFLHLSKTIPCPDLTNDTLKRRIERFPVSTASVTPLLRDWCDRRNKPGHAELRSIITSLHKLERFSHALQVSEWMMNDQKAYNLSPADFEIRLLLTARIRGLEEAAKLLDTIPLKKRDFYVHIALLNCCKTHSSSLSIAETTFQKMKELGFAANSSKPYNTMLCLYHEAENHGMVVKLLGEMDKKNMVPQGVTFKKLLSSFVSASDLKGMENFVNKWEEMIEPWAKCFFPACLHLRLGYRDKGLALLRRTENLLDDGSREHMYGCLIKLYCHEGETEDVYRLWTLAKKQGIYFDSSKRCVMIKAFTEKGDFDRAYEVLEEWETMASNLDLIDFVIQKRYLKETAEEVVDVLGKKESKWESLTQKLNKLVEDEEDREEERRKRVAEAMEERLMNNRWNPKGCLALSAYACVQYAEGRRDRESAANILRLLSKQEQVSNAMDKRRLSLKMVEAMRGGGYVGGHD